MNPTAKIMVIDDEKGICRNVEKILSKNHYDVVCALSAAEALEKMKQESFNLMISDIVMPEMNGLELLKQVKQNWPQTKALMMTAYASTDTAMKAIRLGALDYVPKPFTPEELRTSVEKALEGQLVEVKPSPEEIEIINVIDIDMPFDGDEVATYTGEDYVRTLGRSDMPIVEVKMPEHLENYCSVGEMVCDIFKKLGGTCKVGTKTHACPQKKARKPESGADTPKMDRSGWIGIDMPFNYDEVVAVTGPEYVAHLNADSIGYVPYEELKRNVAKMLGEKPLVIDVDMPFDPQEVARTTGVTYVKTLGPSDMPVVSVTVPEAIENYCSVGEMVCDIFKKLGGTCKAGTKTRVCPQKKAKQAKSVSQPAVYSGDLIAVDMPFRFDEVAEVTGREYAMHLEGEQMVIPYPELKQRVAAMLAQSEGAGVREKTSVRRSALIVDDEVGINNNIRKILEKKGYSVDQAVSKAEALERVESTSYPIIMLDLKMPGVNGLELLQAIRSRRPESMIVIITGYASIETAVESARMGAVGYVSKPFTPDEIRKAADEALRLAA
ncbi:response regulator [Desulfatirhabdium butyrativorans]|uniref:response regulator n=1 Tax=Desulfatirhabdium butyrativorans TaxID=340467 RepID=UPI00040DA1D2|nr:response regulator [Desulfatirhabdium butyrativorans]